MNHAEDTTRPKRRRFPTVAWFGIAAGALALLAVFVVGAVNTHRDTFDGRLASIVAPHRFSIAGWELSNLTPGARSAAETDAVLRYFSLARQASTPGLDAERAALLPAVQATLTSQIHEMLLKAGLDISIGKLQVAFPPVNFRLTEPPRLLVISPRDRIAFQQQVLLRQDVGLPQAESIEAAAEGLGVSSLVLELGGFGATYPTIVSDGASLEYVIETAIHEWLHQYLAFRPLGFRYVLDVIGIQQDPDVVTMNETLASMAAKEISRIVLNEHYPQLTGERLGENASDFDRQMREIRKTVDAMLADGKVEQAEAYMEQERQSLAASGHYIRKLNQAYFAFHGIYADSPGSIDPIGEELRRLRAKSASLKDFLSTVAGMTTHGQLAERVK